VQTIRKYPVQHPVLKDHIRFFWEIHFDDAHLYHKLIPQRNISMRFNLNETPWFLCINGQQQQLDDVFFSGLQDHFLNVHLKMDGKTDVLGVSFLPHGFYPFFRIPVAEFKNQVPNVSEAGFRLVKTIGARLKEARDVTTRLAILERELLLLLAAAKTGISYFRPIFEALKKCETAQQISAFYRQNNIGLRTLERMYNKYVGIPATTFGKLNRFHTSMNQLLAGNFSKLSDVAFDNDYFDQMHFIHDFKRFTGDTPKNFIRQNNSILQVGKLK
jgi:AraC-like DNA-binding protein